MTSGAEGEQLGRPGHQVINEVHKREEREGGVPASTMRRVSGACENFGRAQRAARRQSRRLGRLFLPDLRLQGRKFVG